jgi:hypothetical protein
MDDVIAALEKWNRYDPAASARDLRARANALRSDADALDRAALCHEGTALRARAALATAAATGGEG